MRIRPQEITVLGGELLTAQQMELLLQLQQSKPASAQRLRFRVVGFRVLGRFLRNALNPTCKQFRLQLNAKNKPCTRLVCAEQAFRKQSRNRPYTPNHQPSQPEKTSLNRRIHLNPKPSTLNPNLQKPATPEPQALNLQSPRPPKGARATGLQRGGMGVEI